MTIGLIGRKRGMTRVFTEQGDSVPVTVIEPQFVPGLPDEYKAIQEALRQPIGSSSLRDLVRSDDTAAVVFSDLTRPMPNDRALPPLLDELALVGVPIGSIVLINALGTHRPQTDDELRSMLGDEVVDRYCIVQHDAWADDLVEVSRNHLDNPVCINPA